MNLAGFYAQQMGIKFIYIFKKTVYIHVATLDTRIAEFVREDNSIFQFPEQVKVPLEYTVSKLAIISPKVM